MTLRNYGEKTAEMHSVQTCMSYFSPCTNEVCGRCAWWSNRQDPAEFWLRTKEICSRSPVSEAENVAQQVSGIDAFDGFQAFWGVYLANYLYICKRARVFPEPQGLTIHTWVFHVCKVKMLVQSSRFVCVILAVSLYENPRHSSFGSGAPLDFQFSWLFIAFSSSHCC